MELPRYYSSVLQAFSRTNGQVLYTNAAAGELIAGPENCSGFGHPQKCPYSELENYVWVDLLCAPCKVLQCVIRDQGHSTLTGQLMLCFT